MNEKSSRGNFTGSIGFVMAAAGSAVGLGNIWRFPYLAAKDGGGLFLIIYIVLALTFGFTLLTTEIAIGRKTGQSPLTAYGCLDKRWGFLGVIASVVPVIIMPYYCVIGGWVLKYFITYLTMQGSAAVEEGYFTEFISSNVSPVIFMLIFMAAAFFVVYKGVDKGIEKCSRILMPILFVIILIIVGFSLSLSYTDSEGVTRTGLQGLKVYIIPDLKGMTLKSFIQVVIDAMGQLFYSLSVAMGIMIAYGSYVKKDTDLNKSINQIEIFDSLVAFFAGMMIIPAVFTFMGREGMSASGPSLMFISLPKVFDSMGKMGGIIGMIFFVLVLFAALTSAVSIMEAIVSSLMDKFKMTRKKACVAAAVVSAVVGVIVCLGYNVLYFEVTLPNGAVGQILDILDYFSNQCLMPVVAIATCILVGWILKPKTVIDEVERSGRKMHRKGLYTVMVKYIAPVMLLILLLTSLGII